MKLFSNERELFLKINSYFENKKYENNILEFKNLIKKLFLTYDPSINENKFITGHVTEKIFALLLKSFDFIVKIEGSNKIGYDILINNFEFSIKTSSKPKANIRLKNIHGNNLNYELKYPTILIELGTGILYFDPFLIKKNNIKIKKNLDGFDIKGKDIYKISKIIKLKNFPSKKDLYVNHPTKTREASTDVFISLLNEYSEILVKFW